MVYSLAQKKRGKHLSSITGTPYTTSTSTNPDRDITVCITENTHNISLHNKIKLCSYQVDPTWLPRNVQHFSGTPRQDCDLHRCHWKMNCLMISSPLRCPMIFCPFPSSLVSCPSCISSPVPFSLSFPSSAYVCDRRRTFLCTTVSMLDASFFSSGPDHNIHHQSRVVVVVHMEESHWCFQQMLHGTATQQLIIIKYNNIVTCK